MQRSMDVGTRLLLAGIIAGAAVAFPLGVIASHSFSDVPTNHPFHADISALASSGVTSRSAFTSRIQPHRVGTPIRLFQGKVTENLRVGVVGGRVVDTAVGVG